MRNGRALALQSWELVAEKVEEERLSWKQNAERRAAEGGALHRCAHRAASSSGVTPEFGRLFQSLIQINTELKSCVLLRVSDLLTEVLLRTCVRAARRKGLACVNRFSTSCLGGRCC